MFVLCFCVFQHVFQRNIILSSGLLSVLAVGVETKFMWDLLLVLYEVLNPISHVLLYGFIFHSRECLDPSIGNSLEKLGTVAGLQT